MALNGLKVAQISDQELTETLRYCMVLTGIREKNLPAGLEIQVLFDFIRENFGQHTQEEVKLAFKMATAGRLSVDANCYENFSCAYFGRIMAAYREWSKHEVKFIPTKSQELPQNDTEVDWSNVWQDILQAAAEGRIETKIIPITVYEWLIEKKFLELDVPARIELFKRAKAIYKSELGFQAAISMLKGQQAIEYDILKSEIELPEELHLKISNRAKIIAVREYALTQI